MTESPEKKSFWFQDGDIVLEIEDKHIKIHRHKLMCSLVFSTMLELPQPETAETFDGCPLIRLSGDTFEDWTPVLDWMYDYEWYVGETTPIAKIIGALRISTKYEMLDLRKKSKDILVLRRWSSYSEPIVNLQCTHFKDTPKVICLARQLDIPEILPGAFYALAMQRWHSKKRVVDDALSLLSPEDLRRVLVGRERLFKRLTTWLVNWNPHTEKRFYTLCESCQPRCMRRMVEQLTPGSDTRLAHMLLFDLEELLWLGFLDFLCSRCRSDLREAVCRFCDSTSDAIPKYFNL